MTVRFGATYAVRDVDIEISRGKAVALMGPSGSGKSSLLKSLAGILPPSEGAVTFDGASLYELTEHQRAILRRRRFGFVFQFGQLVPELTLEENVALPLLLDGRRRSEALPEARTLLEELDIGALGKRVPTEVSGGEGQRAAVARALIATPDVVFADEPTGALDSHHGAQVLRLLLGISRGRGSAVLLVTHDQRVASQADRVLSMCDGKLSASVPTVP